jgi:outer membrane protein assembly factor BamB/predicted phosphodiesterase
MQSRRAFLRSAAIGGAVIVSVEAFGHEPLRGRITAKSKPMGGVVVTDGRNCTESALDGTFALPWRKDVRFVSVTVPSGWRTPKFFIRYDVSVASYDFDFQPWLPSRPGPFTFHHVGDSEIGDKPEVERPWLDRVRKFSDERNCAFIVHTGDIGTEYGALHAELMNDETMGRPVYYVLGNHDVLKPEYGEETFERFYAPCWYSFDAGGVHFIVTPMMWGDGNVSFTRTEIVDWLRNDLAIAARRKQPVMHLTHGVYDNRIFDTSELYTKSRIVTEGEDPLVLTEACDFRAIIHGHLHVNYFRRSQDGKIEVVTVAQPQKGFPTLQVVHVDKNCRLWAENRYGHLPSWPVVTEPPRGGWIAQVNGSVFFGAPCVANGRVFVGTMDFEGRTPAGVHAADARTGHALWSFRTESDVKTRILHSGNKVFVQDIDWRVYALDEKSGRLIWKTDTRGDVGLLGAKLYGATDSSTDSALTLDTAARRLYLGTACRSLLALDSDTGVVVWRTKDDYCHFLVTCSAPTVGDGVVVGGLTWRGLYAYDAVTGDELWRHTRNESRVTTEWYASGLPWIERHGFPVIRNGKLYLTSDKEFLEVNLRTGEPIRRVRFPFSVKCYTSPLFHEGRIYFGSQDDGLVCLDEKAFKVLWKAPVEEAMIVTVPYRREPIRLLSSVPVLWKGLVWATCQDGALYAWDPKTGERRERIPTGAPYVAPATVAEDRLYAVDFTGRIRCWA